MAQHDKDPAARSHGASDAPDAGHETAEDGVHRTAAEHADDEAIFAPIEVEPAGAESEYPAAEEPAPAPHEASNVATAVPPRRGKKTGQPFTMLIATLGLVATAGALAAYRFRDKDERLARIAEAVDTFTQPENVFSLARESAVKWLGDAKSAKKTTESQQTAKPSQLAEAPHPAPTAPATPVETEKKPPVPSPPEKGAGISVDQGNGERITWSAPPPPAALPAAPATIATANNGAAAPHPEELAALTKKIDQLEQLTRSALKAAEDARAEASRSLAAASNAAPARDELSGLEGRIDELASELSALREKLDAPKSETRLPREQADIRGSDGEKAVDPAVIIVLAHSLQKALDRGIPFESEYAALKSRGADSEALAALAPTAATGASTSRQLLASFEPVAKQIEAVSAPKPDAPIGDKLLHGVSKLVKVRPANEKPVNAAPEIVAKIQAALGRDDLPAALQAFDELPDGEKNVAQAWGEAARRRLDAEKAAATILSGAIAALGKSKS